MTCKLLMYYEKSQYWPVTLVYKKKLVPWIYKLILFCLFFTDVKSVKHFFSAPLVLRHSIKVNNCLHKNPNAIEDVFDILWNIGLHILFTRLAMNLSKRKCLKFEIEMACRESKTHLNYCYFCKVNISGINRNNHKWKYLIFLI